MSQNNDTRKREAPNQKETQPAAVAAAHRSLGSNQQSPRRALIFSAGFFYIALTVLGLTGFLAWVVWQASEKPLPVAARVVDPPVAPLPAPVAVIERPDEPNTNGYPVAAVTEVEPPSVKLQGIFFNPQNPSAILDGRTVYLGDRVSGYRIMGITPTTVTVVNSTSTNVLSLSGK